VWTVLAVFFMCLVGGSVARIDTLVTSSSDSIISSRFLPQTAEASTTVATSTPKVIPVPVQTAAPVSVSQPTVRATDLRPRQISIPSINLNREIIDVGVTAANNLDVPPNFTQVGWYKYGKRPGEMGSTVLDGHVDNGSTIPGPFKRLREVHIGDKITVTAADGTKFTYKVISSRVWKTVEFPGDFVFHDNSGSLLKIITCHGTFVKEMDTYDHRLIVTAELVKN
jgi:sortase (surface protein transpeptidase)